MCITCLACIMRQSSALVASDDITISSWTLSRYRNLQKVHNSSPSLEYNGRPNSLGTLNRKLLNFIQTQKLLLDADTMFLPGAVPRVVVCCTPTLQLAMHRPSATLRTSLRAAFHSTRPRNITSGCWRTFAI